MADNPPTPQPIIATFLSTILDTDEDAIRYIIFDDFRRSPIYLSTRHLKSDTICLNTLRSVLCASQED
jgi:hypothetical protein